MNNDRKKFEWDRLQNEEDAIMSISDFQKAVSALRGLGIGVTVENNGFLQKATIKGEKVSGVFYNVNNAKAKKLY